MMKNAVEAVCRLIMEDISSVQEVFTTNACQVVLYLPSELVWLRSPCQAVAPRLGKIVRGRGMHRTGANRSES